MNLNIQIISIEGNIGSGKSTLLSNLKNKFQKSHNVIFLKEPVDEWSKIKDDKGVTILEKFYTDQHKYSFSFQMMAYISRLKLLKDTFEQVKKSFKQLTGNYHSFYDNIDTTNIFIITERSLYTDKMVFAKMLHDTGKIENINYQIYLNWFDSFIEEYPISKIIYVKTDPEVCCERICKRNRNGEDNIPLDYVKNCSMYHDKMLDETSVDCVCKNQLVLNGNHDIYENEKILNEWIESIDKFVFNL
jgi:deoxyadenosine/deoxycytidine kinase